MLFDLVLLAHCEAFGSRRRTGYRGSLALLLCVMVIRNYTSAKCHSEISDLEIAIGTGSVPLPNQPLRGLNEKTGSNEYFWYVALQTFCLP